MNLDSGLQILVANLYSPCPQPELAMGMPPHSDHGLLTLPTQSGICGLQLLHNGKWVNVNAIPNSFLVNTGDHIEAEAAKPSISRSHNSISRVILKLLEKRTCGRLRFAEMKLFF
ncbi:hypothetical protein KPL70_006720 [Citrus sinensis]|nr:hypothetical protein KPL70_006720 [Citrus sinensis]